MSLIHSDETLKTLKQYVCLRKDKLCLNLCFNGLGLCDDCKDKYEKYDYNNSVEVENIKNMIVEIIREHLILCENENNKDVKVDHIFKIYRVLICNPFFVISYSKFCFSFISKIKEFFTEDLSIMRIKKYYNDNKNDIYVTYIYNYISEIYNIFKDNNMGVFVTNYDNIIPIYINFIINFYKNINVSVTKPLKLKQNKYYKFGDVTIDSCANYQTISNNIIIL